jgi:hypothetical protein
MGYANPFPHFIGRYDLVVLIPLSLKSYQVIGILLEIKLGCLPDDITFIPVEIFCMLFQGSGQLIRDSDRYGTGYLLWDIEYIVSYCNTLSAGRAIEASVIASCGYDSSAFLFTTVIGCGTHDCYGV